MTTHIRRNQFHARGRGLPPHGQSCDCAACSANNRDGGGDEVIELTRGQLDDLIGKAVEKAVAKELAGDRDDEPVDHSQFATNAEPPHVIAERALEARRQQRHGAEAVDADSPPHVIARARLAARRRGAA